MVKNILIKMLALGDVEVLVNDESSRKIKADDIYTLLNHQAGDKYLVEESNKHGKDDNVLKFFADLMRDITSQLNNLTNQEAEEVAQ